jgi:hypothetical protein
MPACHWPHSRHLTSLRRLLFLHYYQSITIIADCMLLYLTPIDGRSCLEPPRRNFRRWRTIAVSLKSAAADSR